MKKNKRIFTKRSTIPQIIIPVVITIILFVVLIFTLFIPKLNIALMNQKRAAVKNLSESAWSIVNNIYKEKLSGKLTTKEAKLKSIAALRRIRYGDNMKNYIWINLNKPNGRQYMVMHPYRKDLEGKDLHDLQDPKGKYFVREFARVVNEKGGGFVDYHWQYMDDRNKIIPKISYMKGFKPWNWMIGTGLYVDDVKKEITKIINEITLYIFGALLCIIILLIFVSITSLKNETIKINAEKELTFTKQYLRNILNSMPSALISIDKNGTIENINSHSENLLQLKTDEIINKHILHIIPEISFFLKDILSQSHKSKEIYFYKIPISVNDTELFVNITTFSVLTNDILTFVIKIDDISDSVEKDLQLMQAQKMETIGNLAGGLAHDFNNVLGGISGSVDLIKKITSKPETIDINKILNYIDLIGKSSNRAADIVKQLLTLSRKNKPEFVLLDLNVSIQHVLKICKNSFPKSIDLKYENTNEKLIINADPGQIEQTLLNLCINANHAMTIMREAGEKEGGTLSLCINKIKADYDFCQKNPQAQPNKIYNVISLTDTGVGMNIETMQKIFDPFFTKKSHLKGIKGTGLGLSMVNSIINQHHGFIAVNSKIDSGSSFKIYLPSSNNKLNSIEKEFTEVIPKGSGTIMVVDDEINIRKVASDILKNNNYNVITVENGYEAISIYKEKKEEILLILLDLEMPKISGKDTYIELQKINPKLKVLLTSGSRENERIRSLIGMGANGFLHKPYTMDDLCLSVYKIIHDDLNNK